MRQEVADAFDCQVRRTIGLRIVSVLTLTRKDRRHALAPGFLDRGQDPRFVVHEDVVLCRIALLDVIQRLFLVRRPEARDSAGNGGRLMRGRRPRR